MKTTPPVPSYLEEHYWWAYVRPWSTGLLDRQWLINIALCGYYERLVGATLEEFGSDLSGKTLQISCCYGDLTPQLGERIAKVGGELDVIDILPVQLENLRHKLRGEHARLFQMDSSALAFPDGTYDRALIYFLLHEQPQEVREKTAAEAFRVLKPGGKLVIVDYGKPSARHPLRYLLLPLLGVVEPFAIPLWNHELSEVLPHQLGHHACVKQSYFGELYQAVVYAKT